MQNHAGEPIIGLEVAIDEKTQLQKSHDTVSYIPITLSKISPLRRKLQKENVLVQYIKKQKLTCVELVKVFFIAIRGRGWGL